MEGYFSLVLHAHLPFVRHPEHPRFLEENWLFEAITESYLPLLQLLDRWHNDGLEARLTLTLTPTLCAMLQDRLLQSRYQQYLDERTELAEREVLRTLWEKPLHDLAVFYLERFTALRQFYRACEGNLVAKFRHLQDRGQVELITSAATHALLPLLANHLPSLRGQIFVARDQYRACFGRDPRGIWLPECAYTPELDSVLREAGLRWFILESHGLLQAQPRPRFGTFAPVFTPQGLAAFGRDLPSAKQVWSHDEGYPGDRRYRDFYRDIGFDLDWDYLKPYLPGAERRSFTGLKYYRITGAAPSKAVYEHSLASEVAKGHAQHFLDSQVAHLQRAGEIMGRPALIVAPYDAELFGHWWYEGPEFLDFFVRKACSGPKRPALVTPGDYLRAQPTQQVAVPAISSWGEDGYWRVWLNENNQWIYPHLRVAQERMSELVRRFGPVATACPRTHRALQQAARELLLAQSSDWPFILRTGTSPDYARRRLKAHLLRFTTLYEQLEKNAVDEAWLGEIENRDNLFPEINCAYWADGAPVPVAH